MKKGFTLIELLAVIVILAVIALIATPIILNIIKDSRNSSNERSVDLYRKALETAILSYNFNGTEFPAGTYSSTSDGKGLIKNEIQVENFLIDYEGNKVVCDIIKINTSGSIKLGNCKVDNTLVESTIEPNEPILADEMKPVIYDGNNWKVVDSNSEWYDYSNQEWANAVVLNEGVTKAIGEIVNVDTEVKAMLVWIPRYEYKIEGQYGTHTDGTLGTQELPGEIEVKFTSRTIASTGYIMHPAFTFGEDKLTGFWVGKFETTGTESSPTIKPNVASLTEQTVSEEVETAQLFNDYISNVDSHMMKNSEWGAVAYLSQSKYGKYGNDDYTGTNKEVYINNSSRYYTGRSGGAPGGSTAVNTAYPFSTTSQYNWYGFYTYDGYLLEYNTNTKSTTKNLTKVASTTGNITGVYDMSGGRLEYVMGYYTPASTTWGATSSSNDAGFTGTPDTKYFDAYTTTTSTTSCNGGICYGHALSETAGWYNDSGATFDAISNSYPWFARGGHYNHGIKSGIMRSNYYNGAGNDAYSFRISLANTTS